ncbi:MAG: ABC transporter ATP-binding protein [Candidatus Desantisbacteria bacterium]
MIEMSNITKNYLMGEKGEKGEKEEKKVEALRGVSLNINEGEFVSIMGASGSGKSTLLSIMGCLDVPTGGIYLFEGQEVSILSDDELSRLRNEKIGFVFQAFHLLPRFSALENVEIPLIYKRVPSDERKERAKACLEQVGLGHRIGHAPSELSGGEQQRTAIARALVNSPRLILADEPTGNLDSTSAQEVMDLLSLLNREKKITIVIITHNPQVAERTTRVYHLQDGQVINEGN